MENRQRRGRVEVLVERLLKALVKEKPWSESTAFRLLVGLTTYVAVLIAWVYFRAKDFETANRILAGMFGTHARADAILGTREIVQVISVTALMLVAHWSLRESSLEAAVARLPRGLVTIAWAFMVCALILTQGNSNAFIYFQF